MKHKSRPLPEIVCWRDAVYFRESEPAIVVSTSLLALCCQSAPEPTCETPISARSRSYASRSLRRIAAPLRPLHQPIDRAMDQVREPS